MDWRKAQLHDRHSSTKEANLKNSKTTVMLALAALLGSCGSQADDNPSDAAASQDTTNLYEEADRALAAADSALANADMATLDAASTNGAATSMQGSSAPLYSSTAYCLKIGETAGGSSVIERSCRDMEAEALATIRARQIPARIRSYCDKIGQTAGGSYVIYNSCVDMELEAASDL